MADTPRVTLTLAPNQAALDLVREALKPLLPVPVTSLELQPSQISVFLGLSVGKVEARVVLETDGT